MSSWQASSAHESFTRFACIVARPPAKRPRKVAEPAEILPAMIRAPKVGKRVRRSDVVVDPAGEERIATWFRRNIVPADLLNCFRALTENR
jgi:hypothetical protein